MEDPNSSLSNIELRVGPWGGKGGREWSYRPRDGITKITVAWCSGMIIHSLIFQSQDGKTEKFGGRSTTAPTNQVNINIDYPNEFLTGISGHTYRLQVLANPSFVIGSLKFYTNCTAHGPFGYEFGDPFFFCPEDGVIITGFFGRDDYYIDAIGVYYRPIRKKVPIIKDNSNDKKENHNSSLCNGELRVGPWGGEGGDEWSYKPTDGITKITVAWCSRMVIHSLIFQSQDGKTEKFGGRSTTAPTNQVTINIDYPNEFLTGVSGHTYRLQVLANPSFVIGSLKFYTNRTAHGPIGYEFGDPFSFCSEEDVAMVTGFFGRDGYYIDAIGVYYRPILKVPLIENNSNDKKLRNPGPWGGYYGKVFDDGVFCGIKKIHVHLCTNKGAIAAIRFEYVNKKGDAHWSPMHGAAGGTMVRKLEIDSTNEFLIGVQGFYGQIEGRGGIAITSLTFYTNKGKYGPLGREIGKFFSSVVDNAKVVGFFGKCGEFLNAIGMHNEYL